MIGKLSDEVLLNIFRHYLDGSPQFWPHLTHICRKWRHIVFVSKRVLRLRLFCTHGTPVLKALSHWPALPIVVQYGGPSGAYPVSPEDEENIVAALMQSDRVSSICLTVTSSLLKKLSAIEGPFLALEDLVLLSRDGARLPNAFRWGPCLRTLHLARAVIPALPKLLSHSMGLVDLQLHEIPNDRYCPPDSFANTLSVMTQLRSLSLHVISLLPSRNHLGFPPRLGERVALPALTCLKYRGTSEFLDNLVSRIDAPCLGDIDITFLTPPTAIEASQLCQFINLIEMQKSHRQAEILFSERVISITFARTEAPTRLELQVPCKHFAQQLSYTTRICNGLSASLRGVEHLRVCATQLTNGQDDSDNAEWQDLIGSFIGVKWIHLAGEHSINIMLALQHPDMRYKTVLPSLHKICIQQHELRYGPLQEAIVSLMHSRLHLGHIIGVEWINEFRRKVGPFCQQVTIGVLSDEVFLNIFHHYLRASPQLWHTLTHICKRWRHIVLSSPIGLHLQLYCTHGTPVLKTLECWPPFPLVVNYGGSSMAGHPAP
ncbi:hypothetical protein V8E53_013958, partial [Lactarius tabidus]